MRYRLILLRIMILNLRRRPGASKPRACHERRLSARRRTLAATVRVGHIVSRFGACTRARTRICICAIAAFIAAEIRAAFGARVCIGRFSGAGAALVVLESFSSPAIYVIVLVGGGTRQSRLAASSIALARIHTRVTDRCARRRCQQTEWTVPSGTSQSASYSAAATAAVRRVGTALAAPPAR
jgi:hypothetical protein